MNRSIELKQAEVTRLNAHYGSLPAAEVLALALEQFSGQIAFANSFGLEDVVVLHMLLQLPQQPEVFVLDTGRLPEATYELIELWRMRYDLQIRLLSPKAELLEEFVQQHGPNGFYKSLELRKLCCSIRKLEPLERALHGKAAWISGLRREQSQARAALQVFELDQAQRIKISPLAHWQLDQLWAYIRTHDVPYNQLHDRGYPSIGCAPCTRAVAAGEDLRSGRWWWELDSQRECGLHIASKGGLTHATESPR